MIFPRIVSINNKPKQKVRVVNPARQLNFKKPTGCNCGMNKWKIKQNPKPYG